MSTIDRRTFLRRSAVAAAATVGASAGPFGGFIA
ncbi:MAG: twin-arginine translocation signal domain-containing protein, partial [Gaiellaceae bacterium]